MQPQQRHAGLLQALSLALSIVQAPAYAQALAGIDFDLPDAAPAPEDRTRLEAAAPLYFASALERAGLLPTAELVAGLFASGAINQPLGPAERLLHDFWRRRRERLSAGEREAVYARVVEDPQFEPMMRVLCEAISAQAGPMPPGASGLREQVVLATHAQSMASFLAQRVDPMAVMAAREIVGDINAALAFMRDRRLQAAFSVGDLWRLVELAGSQAGIPTGSPLRHVERGRSGQTVLLWLAAHPGGSALALDPSSPQDIGVMVAAQRWLASVPAGSTRPPLYPQSALPLVA
ncbi:hypothetical protein CSC68_03715 [Pseudoxanthomonas suwonensis]|nr:hypothetical protein CSC68_03715 [Pseudoxanthomonas suwonensis]